MGFWDFIFKKKSSYFTFKNRNGEDISMNAKDIYDAVMQDSKKSDYNWIVSAGELVKICKDQNFPLDYAIDIEMAIVNCFANIEARVNLGGDKYVDKLDNVLAVQYCYDELGRWVKSLDDEELKNLIISARSRYLKEMISSAVNTAIRGDFIYLEEYVNLRDELIEKYFVQYFTQEDFIIKDMYKEIYKDAENVFNEVYESSLFDEGKDVVVFSVVKKIDDDDILYPKNTSHTFKGDHATFSSEDGEDIVC